MLCGRWFASDISENNKTKTDGSFLVDRFIIPEQGKNAGKIIAYVIFTPALTSDVVVRDSI